MSELDKALLIARATYERWLGIDPHQIEAAAAALCGVDARHPLLSELESRAARARAVRAMLDAALRDDTDSVKAVTEIRRLA